MLGHDDACKNIFRHRQVVADRGANWDFLARLRERWPRRLVVKGVLNPEDAQRLQALGVDAVQVSNHGARQLDAALSPLEALPATTGWEWAELPGMAVQDWITHW